jgi:hypothetical protein
VGSGGGYVVKKENVVLVQYVLADKYDFTGFLRFQIPDL